ncbi:MAG: response regulator transcription factor [Patescibacteria group bacterium]
MRILLIEDDIDLTKALVECLQSEHMTVDTCHEGDTGSYIARTNAYDLILLDHILPKKLGTEICKELRRSYVKTPILIMSIHGNTDDRIAYLEAGADDCIAKPFSIAELVIRIKTLVRRPYDIKEEIITIDDVTIDVDSLTVSKKGKQVYMTRKEFLILEQIAKKPGQVVSRMDIMDHVWNKDFDPFSNTIETHIRNIRRKIGDGKNTTIETVPGRGYRVSTKATGTLRAQRIRTNKKLKTKSKPAKV